MTEISYGVLDAVRRKRLAIGVAAQSNEHNAVLRSEMAAWPQAFGSLRKPADRAPHFPAVTLFGGWWSKVQDDLWDLGWDVVIVNGAVGSSSLVSDWAGQFTASTFRSANPIQKRLPTWSGDRGTAGDLVFVSGVGYFRCTKGNHLVTLATGQRPYPSTDSGSDLAYQDFKVSIPGGNVRGLAFNTTGSAQPTWAGPVGNVVTDGGCEWTCERTVSNGYYPAGGPGPEGVFQEQHAGYGFDPHGLCQRLHEAMQRVDADRKIIIPGGGQSALGSSAALYSAAMQSEGNYFLNRGYEVMPSLTCFKPDASNGIANYDALKAGVADATTALKGGQFGSRVWTGPDLYTSMGTTGPMGGARVTGSIAGSTLTVTATTAGAIEVGHIVYDGQTPVGTVTALGTGTGGNGTYTLMGASDRTSRTLAVAGVFLQSDLTHLSGAGVVGPDVGGKSCAAKYHVDALKVALGVSA